jgi:hypothetical protein
MSTIEILRHKAESLPDALQREVIDFVDYLLSRYTKNDSTEEKEWSAFSMQNAIRGFEDDPVTYTKADIRQK